MKNENILGLSDNLLDNVIQAINNGENYDYHDEHNNITVKCDKNGVAVNMSYQSEETHDKDVEIVKDNFAAFNNMLDVASSSLKDGDLFLTVCNSFTAEELNKMNNILENGSTEQVEIIVKEWKKRTKEILNNLITQYNVILGLC